MERMVKLQNMVNKTVGVIRPEFNINREWVKKGQVHQIPFSTVEQLLYINGFRNMIENGTLYIVDMQDKIDLGLEAEGTKEPTNIKALTDGQMLTLMKITDMDKFVETVNELPKAQVDNLVNYAIENELLIVDKCMFLKDVTGVDIIQCVKNNKEIENIPD